MAITITEINTAIAETLAAATGLSYTQDYDELTEGMQDTPTLQVYWFDLANDVTSGTAQRSFGGQVREKRFGFRADLYAQQRAHIGEDMARLLPLVDAIHDKLEAQQHPPYFGLGGIRAVERWSGRQVVFDYGGARYVGARFEIVVRVF